MVGTRGVGGKGGGRGYFTLAGTQRKGAGEGGLRAFVGLGGWVGGGGDESKRCGLGGG